MDDYVIKHFRIAFGNRIVAHMKKFVPVYVGCGGDEIDGYIEFLDKTFGKGKMKECEEYLLRLKKLT